MLPLYSLMLATEPLPAAVWDEIGWSGGETMAAGGHQFTYAQRTRDGRVALGGRGTLIGPLLGAGLVNGMKSWFTVAFPEYWLFALGALFIVVTLFLPKGVIGLIKRGDKS